MPQWFEKSPYCSKFHFPDNVQCRLVVKDEEAIYSTFYTRDSLLDNFLHNTPNPICSLRVNTNSIDLLPSKPYFFQTPKPKLSI